MIVMRLVLNQVLVERVENDEEHKGMLIRMMHRMIRIVDLIFEKLKHDHEDNKTFRLDRCFFYFLIGF